jgi:hypothetical protein
MIKCGNSIIAAAAARGFRRTCGTGKSLSFVSAQAPALMLALVVCSPLPSVMSPLSALRVLARRCRSLPRPSVLSSAGAVQWRGLLRSQVSSCARWAFRRGARPSLASARLVAAQPVSLPHVRRSVALGGPSGRKNSRLSSRSASASSDSLRCRSAPASSGGSCWRWVGLRSASAPGLFPRSSGASCSSIRVGANPAVNRTPCQLRWQVPSGLRPPVAGYLER